jgi:hypothetical protein
MTETHDELIHCLKQLNHILEAEQQLLIAQDGEVLEEVLQEKTKWTLELSVHLKALDLCGGLEGVPKSEIKILASEMKRRQETNAMLARQTLQYLEALRAVLKPQSGAGSHTYERSGHRPYEPLQSSSWLDRSV